MSYLDASYVDPYEPQPSRPPSAVRVIHRLSSNPMGDEPCIDSFEHPWSHRHMPGMKRGQKLVVC